MKKTLFKKWMALIMAVALVATMLPMEQLTAKAGSSATITIVNSSTTTSIEGANTSRNLAVGTDGTIHVVYLDSDGYKVQYVKSTDKGATFSSPVTVASGCSSAEAEVAVSSNGRVFVAYKGDSASYIAYSDNGSTFTSVSLGTNDGSIHMATDGDHVYAINRYGTTFWYSSDKGATYSSHTGWSGYAYSDVMVDKTNHTVLVLKDNPSVVYRTSTDYGATFTDEAAITCDGTQISVYYSTATMGNGYAYMAGMDSSIYKIDYTTGTATAANATASSESQGRSVSADTLGNVIAGYVNDSKVYFQLSTDSGASFGDAIEVAEATAANAAINPYNGDVLFLYVENGVLKLYRIEGIISYGSSSTLVSNDADTEISGIETTNLDAYAEASNADVSLTVEPLGTDTSNMTSDSLSADELKTAVSALQTQVATAYNGVPASDQKTEYLDIELKASVDGGAYNNVSDTGYVLEIAVKYDMTGKYCPMIMRYHNGSVSRFTKLTSRPSSDYTDGTFYVDGTGEDATIYIYSKLFSLYSISYTTSQYWTVTFDDDNGNTSTTMVKDGTAVAAPTEPTRSGYTFDGWYNGDTAWDFAAAVTSDLTLKAKWTYNKTYVASLWTSKQTANTITLKWKKISDADGYIIYQARCGKTMTKVKTITKSSKTTWTAKNLKKGKSYKFRLVAYKLVDGKKVTLVKSNTVHTPTLNSKTGGATGVKVNKKSVSLSVGNTAKLKASEIKGTKTILKHRKIWYASSDKNVATVGLKTGKITAVGTGTCKIYVYAQNGLYKTVKVTVK